MVDLDGYPAGTRIIVCGARPHPGVQLPLFEQDEDLRHQVFLADAPCSGGPSPVIFFAVLQWGCWPPGPVWLCPLCRRHDLGG
ncbi:hypothetical protein ACFZBA_36955, partial [Streptomyces sioyaensis]